LGKTAARTAAKRQFAQALRKGIGRPVCQYAQKNQRGLRCWRAPTGGPSVRAGRRSGSEADDFRPKPDPVAPAVRPAALPLQRVLSPVSGRRAQFAPPPPATTGTADASDRASELPLICAHRCLAHADPFAEFILGGIVSEEFQPFSDGHRFPAVSSANRNGPPDPT